MRNDTATKAGERTDQAHPRSSAVKRSRRVKRAGSGTARPSLDDLFQGWVSAFGWVEGVHDRCCLTLIIHVV